LSHAPDLRLRRGGAFFHRAIRNPPRANRVIFARAPLRGEVAARLRDRIPAPAGNAMPNYSPELVASVLHDHVHTDKPVRQIAADHKVNERDVTRMRHAAGIPPRGARVRTLPSAMGELHKAAMRLMANAAQPDGAATGSGPSPPPLPDRSEGTMQPFSDTSVIERIERLIERELAAEEATRAELGLLARTPTEAERCARTVASMTRTLHVLMRLRASAAPEQGPSNVDDYPADIDAFRDEFARRIRAFVASRTDPERAAAAGPAEGRDPV
jgi:hypothetical protein